MSLWCIVPIKSFSSGKSRLAGRLSMEQRILLNHNLAENTIFTCKALGLIEQVLIVSSGREMHRFAVKCGVAYIEEPPGGINAALDAASHYAENQGADSLLVLHGDLPSLRAAEIETLIKKCDPEKGICIVPDHHRTGTNALMMRPPSAIPFLFGEGSFARHLNAARDKNMSVHTLILPSIAFDLDTIEDLEFALHRDFLSKELSQRLYPRGE